MAYIKTTWADDVTPISAEKMNKIEQGILDAVPKTEKGVANGVATLDTSTQIILAQLAKMTTKTITQFPGEEEIYVDNNGASGGGYDLTWVLKKQCQSNITGILRVKFNLAADSDNWYVQGRIYINGAPRGIARLADNTTPVLYTEDFSINTGDLIQVYMTTYQNNTTYTGKNYLLSVSKLVEVVLA